MYICCNCGELIEDEDFPTITQTHGYTSLGFPINEEVDGCCSCGGDFVEAQKCKICGTYFAQEDCEEICKDCFDDEKSCLQSILDFGYSNKEDFPLSFFFTRVFTPEKIHDILEDYVRANEKFFAPEIKKFIYEYESEFHDYLVEEQNKEEQKSIQDKKISEYLKKETIDYEKFMEEDGGDEYGTANFL